MRYFKSSKSIDKADEIIIRYDERETDLIRFAEEHSDIKVIADITHYFKGKVLDDIDIFKCAKAACPLFTILLNDNVENEGIIPALQENGINFFFPYYYGGTLDKIESQIVRGASEVYITNELGFNIKALSEQCHHLNVKVRVLPNIAQSSASLDNTLDTYKFFFIRPEDMELYSLYVDTVEFFGEVQEQDTFYDIYFNKRKWEDDLTFLIKGLKTPLLGNTIPPDGYYAKRRLSCRKECYKCEACDSVVSIARTMREKGFSFNAKGELLRMDDIPGDIMPIKPERTPISLDGNLE